MVALSVKVEIDKPPEQVWEELADISSHTEWMTDAVKIRFLTSQREGAGTRFSCVSRVGFLSTTDVMEITEWLPGEAMGVIHKGAVSGTGRFKIAPADNERGTGSVLRWTEELRFPLWAGGGLTAAVAAPVLRRIWQRNLLRFKQRVEVS